VGFRNPLRSLPADNITGGAFTGTYTVPGTFTVGDAGAGHIRLDGATPALKLYAADGTTVLVDLEPTGPTFTGVFRTAPDGTPRVQIQPSLSGNPPDLSYYTEAVDEVTPPRDFVDAANAFWRHGGVFGGVGQPAKHKMSATVAGVQGGHTLEGDVAVLSKFGCNGKTPQGKAANPGTAAGTDAAVINSVVTALRNIGIVT
jgi:hypothetical protein